METGRFHFLLYVIICLIEDQNVLWELQKSDNKKKIEYWHVNLSTTKNGTQASIGEQRKTRCGKRGVDFLACSLTYLFLLLLYIINTFMVPNIHSEYLCILIYLTCIVFFLIFKGKSGIFINILKIYTMNAWGRLCILSL